MASAMKATIACIVLGAACAADQPASDIEATVTTLDSSPEDETRPPPTGPTSGGGAKIREDDLAALLAETGRMRPPPELFEFVGYVPILTPAQHAAKLAERDARRARMTVAQYEATAALESHKDERDSARMVLVSADGRMYRERTG